MILGVYWYFGFPEGLYSYDYFKFSKGYGGHADNLAELVTTVEVDDADGMIEELKRLVDQYVDAFIFIYKSGKHLQIGTGDYSMHDYDFELALKMELILIRYQAKPIANFMLKDAELIRFSNDRATEILRLSKKHFNMVGSSLKKQHAETSAIRFDCNVEESKKKDFLDDVKLMAESVNIHVVYYLEKKYGDRYNLMLFFTNGRQGIGLTPKQKVDVVLFETAMDVLIKKYIIQIGHVGGWDNYPSGKPIVVKIVDAEFILESE